LYSSGDEIEDELFEDITAEWLKYQRKHSDVQISYQEFLDIDFTLSTTISITNAEILNTSNNFIS